MVPGLKPPSSALGKGLSGVLEQTLSPVNPCCSKIDKHFIESMEQNSIKKNFLLVTKYCFKLMSQKHLFSNYITLCMQ
jgi:hypothetical protein